MRGFFGQSYSTLLPYRVGGRLRLAGAVPVERPGRSARGGYAQLAAAAGSQGPHFRLALASLGGRWSPVGDLRVAERLPDDETERLAFTPWNTGGGIRPVGPFMGLRRAAYRASQRARGVPESQTP
ncbi:MAG: hypothetical protein H0V26_11200 [Solirubrobacterales bacterium]|nr:hypothetical protein [Solirubrobacterales bacterium]